MIGIGALPESLTVNGREYRINADYRVCLKILLAMTDPEITDGWRRVYILLYLLYDAFEADDPAEAMPEEDYEAAYAAACGFLDHGAGGDKKPARRLMDWEQDEDILFPAVNRAAGFEVRAVDFMHWWTFLGLVMSVDADSVWANVLHLRGKRAKGKKLEKWEQEYWSANRAICELRRKETPEDRARKEELKKLFVRKGKS